MTAALRFVGGDEVVEPFLLTGTDGDIIDLTTVTVTGGVWWRERQRIVLTAGAGIEFENDAPALAEDPEDQVPHGNIVLSELHTATIPHGQVASLRLKAVRTLDGITMSTYFAPLERIA